MTNNKGEGFWTDSDQGQTWGGMATRSKKDLVRLLRVQSHKQVLLPSMFRNKFMDDIRWYARELCQ